VSSTYQLTLSCDAVKFIAKQERRIQERIRKSLTGLVIRPPVGDIKPPKKRGKLLRLRVGTYRVIFDVPYGTNSLYIDCR